MSRQGVKRLSVDIPEALMNRLDAECERTYKNRTEVVKDWLLTLPEAPPIKESDKQP
jgi:metal-responsive CopG/Arc/MetJ family transcriptional regulator